MKTKGWKQVFKFTYIQNVKAKAFRVSTAIMGIIIILICVGINLLPTLISEEQFESFFGETGDISEVETLYVLDESELSVKTDFSEFETKGISVKTITAEEFEAKRNEVTESQQADLLLHITQADEKNTYSLNIYRPESEEYVSAGSADMLCSSTEELFNDAILMSNGVSKDNLEAVKADISTEVSVFNAEPSRSEMQMAMSAILPMFSAIIFFSFTISYSQLIAQAVATEKTSRVMELLLTSVRPLAVIIGKVIGMLCVAMTQLAIFGVCGTLGFVASMPFGIIPKAISGAAGAAADAITSSGGAAGSAETVSQVGSQLNEALPGLNPLTIIAIVLVFVLGFLFYALLAGLVGASISRIEDLATAMQPMMFIALAGFFLSYFPAVFNIENETGNNTVLTIARFLPISSPFSLPSAMLLGEMNAVESSIAVVALAVFVVLTAMLVAKVYQHIVLHSGNPLKFSQLLKLAKKEK